ncbi:Serine protease, subtilisin family [Lentzea waywayandensis]|uniref:Serine protease, subtilisin family n=1 Tax=Lentzea waywayandensis TaxID=84724 RepID=A0A1I6F6W7_9PSEU|nr:S8 family serine peptidase [Lentzea waywayandensis]SFR25769.1 Serine protease, subtilisin family [Lentzea waywayandensis]
MYRKRSAALAAALLLSVAVAKPAAASGTEPQAVGTPGVVTLITGDQVVVDGDRVSSVRMAKGREQLRAWRYRLDGHDHVVPQDAVADLKAGKLDKRLFDVTGLVQQGYDDRNEPTVPTIVTGANVLTAGVNAVYIPKAEAAGRWRERGSARLGAEKTWLNGRVRPTLDESVKQIGAPKAWQAGFRGDGVKVAVLDTGYDTAHPDLKSVVDTSADFTGEGVRDLDGHGTHVASTIAGSGAASQGRYQGVAPGARLLVGKVLGEFGGREDWVLNGMRWAVAQGADVVNMSLGGGVTDGTDLMSQTVNELSAASGTLFVIAAGNYGLRESVGSPGAADRALTVANVTKQDKLNLTSSQGPRLGDFGLKPEIAGPGTDIVAARAAGLLPEYAVGDSYARLSGTSMASPHVAGAAAILAQQHPDWTGEQIKNALIGSSRRLPGISTLAQGAGRLDIARGVAQQVRAEGVAGFGTVWGTTESRREITYVNSGDKPVTLALDLEVDRKNVLSVQKSVTVPAGGSAAVTVTARPTVQTAGELTGVLRARAGDVVLTTPVTGQFNGEKRTLTVKVPPRSGESFQSLVIVQNERTGQAFGDFTSTDSLSLTVPSGPYRVLGLIAELTGDNTFFAQRVEVAGDTTVDANTMAGRPITVGVDDPDARSQLGGGFGLLSDPDESGPLESAGILRGGGVPRNGARLYSVAGPDVRGLSLTNLSYFNHPWALTTVSGAGRFELGETYFPWTTDFTGGYTGRLVGVGEADRASIEAADVSGAIAVITPKNWDDPVYPPGEQLMSGVELLKQKGARAVLSYFNPTIDSGSAAEPALPTGLIFDSAELRRVQNLMAQRTVEATMSVRPNSPVAYFLGQEVKGLPGGYDFKFTKAGLGRIERRLIDTMPANTYRFGAASWTVGPMRAGADVESKWPQRRTDYISPAAAVQLFDAGAFLPDGRQPYSEITLPVRLQAGEKRTSRVFAAPFGPELTTPPIARGDDKPLPWAYRSRDRISLMIPMFSDSDPGTVSYFDPSHTGTTVLSRNGKEVGRGNDRAALGTFDVPSGAGWFTLAAEAVRPTGNLTPALSTKVRSEWRFHSRSGTDERAALPLLDIRYALDLDDHNTAHGPVRGTVSVAHQPGAPSANVRSIGVEVSFDDGVTWQRVKVAGGKLELPAGTTGFASLRATATDVLGNSVTETITRAYAVK